MRKSLDIKNWFSKNDAWLVPLIFCLAIFMPFVVWVFLDESFPNYDMGRHLYHTLEYRRILGAIRISELSPLTFFNHYSYYPPFNYWLTNLFYLPFGYSAKVALLTNIIWLFILYYATYNIAREIWNRKTAVLSLIFLTATPILIGQLREYLLDLPMLAIVTLTFLLLYKSKYLQNLRISIILGLVIGIGMLIKWNFLYFVAAEFLIFFIYSLINGKKEWRRIIFNSILIILIAFLIDAYWYLLNYHQLVIDFMANAVGVAKGEGDPLGFHLQTFLYYPRMFVRFYYFIPLSILIIAGLIYSIFGRTARQKNALLIVWFLLAYLIFVILPNKDVKYLMSTMGILAIISVSILNVSKNRLWQIGLFSIISLLILINYTTIAFGRYLPIKITPVYIKNNIWYPILNNVAFTTGSPQDELCPIEDIFEKIPDSKRVGFVGKSTMELNDWNVAYWSLYYQKNWAGQIGVDQSDFLIYREGVLIDNGDRLSQYLQKSALIGQFDCRDGSKLNLLKVKK